MVPNIANLTDDQKRQYISRHNAHTYTSRTSAADSYTCEERIIMMERKGQEVGQDNQGAVRALKLHLRALIIVSQIL